MKDKMQKKTKVKYNEQEIERDLINLFTKKEKLRVRGCEFKGKIIDCCKLKKTNFDD